MKKRVKTKEIKKWLIDKDFTQAEIGRAIGCSRAMVCRTVNGVCRHWRVIGWFVDHGCPEELFGPPRKKAA
jgi:hypothetical protein